MLFVRFINFSYFVFATLKRSIGNLAFPKRNLPVVLEKPLGEFVARIFREVGG